MEQQLIPYNTSTPPAAKAVLALAPHPDDEVFGCGATLALHVQSGCRVHVAVMTRGDLGGDAEVRRAESLRAALELGYEPPDFWGLPDRGVLYGEALVQRIQEAIIQCGAEVLYAPSLWENHPDHRAAALAAREAVRRQERCVLMAYEIGAPLRPNRLVDITPVLERKRAAMRQFTSQLAVQAYDRQIEALNVFRTYTLQHAAIQAIEAFEHADAAALRTRGQAFLESEYTRQRESGLMLLPEDADFVTVMIRSMDRPELDRALSSIAVQTWPRVEVVVVNAKGPGHRPLPAWCGRFPLRLVDSDVRLHRSVAANRALDAASGDSLMFLDDDDWLDPDHIAKLAQGLLDRPDAVAAVTGAQGIDPQGRRVAEWLPGKGEHRLMLANQMPIMSVLFRRARLGSARFDEELDVFEDWDFWLQLGITGVFVGVPGVSAHYLIRPFDGSGVHQQAVAQAGRARVRHKWRARWPEAWYEQVNAELQALEGLATGTSARIEQLESQLQTAQGEHQASVAQLQPLTAALQAAQAAQHRAEHHNATMEHLRNIAEQQRHQAEQQWQQAEHQRAHAEDQLRQAQSQREQSAAQLIQIEAQKANAEHQRMLEENLHAVAQAQLAEAGHALAQEQLVHQQERERLLNDSVLARQAVDQMQQQMNAVLRSRSWRAAAPLRWAGRTLRRIMGRP